MSDEEMLKHYSATLDEIYRLRQASAWEAQHLEWVLSFSTLPQRVRRALEDLQERMKATACGLDGYDHLPDEARHDALANCKGAPTTLTRHEWESKR